MPKKKSDKEAKPKSEAIKKPSAKKATKVASTKPAPPAPEPIATPAPKTKPKKAEKPAKPAKPAKAPEIVITNDDIALRAYYIAERRQKLGWPGDSTGDWVEAERQLRAEAKKKKT